MSDTRDRAAITELLVLFDHLLEEDGFGWDHWHSILWNLHNVRPEEWTQLPTGGGRTIRDLFIHLGVTFVMYENHAFGDESRSWNDASIDGVLPGNTPESAKEWIKLAHKRLRDTLSQLSDADLSTPRKAPWGDVYETRRLIELQIQHTLYHVGEINHIRALLQSNDDWDHQDMGRDLEE